MNNIRTYVDQIQEIADRIPLGKKEVYTQLGIGPTQWYRLRKGDKEMIPHAKTIRAMKAFIEKYKDIQ